MDHRRPIRPPHPTGAPRRPLFTTSSATSHPSRTNSRTSATSKPTAVHIPPDDTNNRDDDLVERDATGNYKIMAPSTAMKMGVEPPVSPEHEEKEQEDQMISLYGKSNCHWDQAGRGGGMVRRGAASLCQSLERLSLGNEHEWEWDGWGYWDAEARLAMLKETEEMIEVEGYCKWTTDKGESLWVEHADKCAAILDEIKVALKSSLERKVGSLEADRWMFEGEGGRKI